MTFRSCSLVDEKGDMGEDNSICRQLFVKKADPEVLERSWMKEDCSLMLRSLSTAIRTAGDVILH